MKKYIRRFLLIAAALLVVFIGGTHSDCVDCGFSSARLPLAVFGSLLGCSGEKKSEELAAGSMSEELTDEISEVEPETETSALKGKTITLIELGSIKCVPCRMMVPVLDEVKKKYSPGVKVVFHDVWTDEGRPYGEKYGIRGIPTQIFLDKDGNEFFRHVGFLPIEGVEKVLRSQGIK